MRKHIFYSYHPIVTFTYFVSVILITIFNLHPFMLGITLISSLIFAIQTRRRKLIKSIFFFILPMFVFLCILNPLFSHRGVTILFYLNNNPITLESIIYGVASGTMGVAMFLWSQSYNEIMSSDKFIYLFGNVFPSLSLLITMALGLGSKLLKHIKEVANSQKLIGKDPSSGNVIVRAKNGIQILSIATTWALENSIETSMSMKARGYGLKGRTTYSLFKFEKRDSALLLIIMITTGLTVGVGALGHTAFLYYPYIEFAPMTFQLGIALFSFGTLSFLPIFLEIMEAFKWHILQSKISPSHTLKQGKI